MLSLHSIALFLAAHKSTKQDHVAIHPPPPSTPCSACPLKNWIRASRLTRLILFLNCLCSMMLPIWRNFFWQGILLKTPHQQGGDHGNKDSRKRRYQGAGPGLVEKLADFCFCFCHNLNKRNAIFLYLLQADFFP